MAGDVFAQSKLTSDSKFTVVYNAHMANIYKREIKWSFKLSVKSKQKHKPNVGSNIGCTHKLEYSHNTARLLENGQIVLHGWYLLNNVSAYSIEAHALFPTFLSLLRLPLVGNVSVYVRLIVSCLTLGNWKCANKISYSADERDANAIPNVDFNMVEVSTRLFSVPHIHNSIWESSWIQEARHTHTMNIFQLLNGNARTHTNTRMPWTVRNQPNSIICFILAADFELMITSIQITSHACIRHT